MGRGRAVLGGMISAQRRDRRVGGNDLYELYAYVYHDSQRKPRYDRGSYPSRCHPRPRSQSPLSSSIDVSLSVI